MRRPRGRPRTSFRLHGTCTIAQWYQNTDYWGWTEKFRGSTPNIGGKLNDNAHSVRVWQL